MEEVCLHSEEGDEDEADGQRLLQGHVWRSKCTKNQARTTLMSAIYFSWIYPFPRNFIIKTFMSKVCAKCAQRATLRLGRAMYF